MNVFEHPVYRDLSRFFTTRGLRTLRHQLRKADAILVATLKRHGKAITAKERMLIVYESELHAQEKRRAIISAPIEVSQDGERISVRMPNAEVTGRPLADGPVDRCVGRHGEE